MLINNFSILYVEDEIYTRRALSSILGEFFKEVYVADNGQDALELYKKNKFDIVLSDISMPILDGIEMSREIKKINKEQLIILFTASQNYKYLDSASEIGVYRYVLKPIVSIEDFIKVLECAAGDIIKKRDFNKLLEDDFFSPTDLFKGYQNDEFIIHYQPQINISDGSCIGVDALSRWNSQDGLIYPNNFVLGAIKVGLMVMIDEWVLKTSMKEISGLYKKGLNPGILSVNLSTRGLEQKDFIDNLNKYIKETGFDKFKLEFKVREHDLVIADDKLIDKINEISDMGVRISVANFGKGFLSYIKKISIDKIKINKSYIDDIILHEDSNSAVKAILNLGKRMNIDIVAAGVENRKQLKYLSENGCLLAQGFLYSKAIPLKSLELYLKAYDFD